LAAAVAAAVCPTPNGLAAAVPTQLAEKLLLLLLLVLRTICANTKKRKINEMKEKKTITRPITTMLQQY
jgi:hypothetical protein